MGTLPILTSLSANSWFLQRVKQSIQNTVITDLPGTPVGRIHLPMQGHKFHPRSRRAPHVVGR